jgi:hypothetical protein
MISEASLGAEEGKSSGCVELDQPNEEQAAEEDVQHPALAGGRPDAMVSSAARLMGRGGDTASNVQDTSLSNK